MGQQWHGDSRGRWEGDTLVVETTNYRPSEGEIAPDTLQWTITFEDPATWTQPWTAVMMMSSTDEALFEYACHEGNIGMEGILAGTRELEHAAVSR